jgi:Flp pilus assembly protein TadG
VLTVIFLVVLLGFAGFAIDVGHAYLVQRQLQSGVDAAALAGAQELPDATQAIDTAERLYGPTPGASPNAVTTVDNATTVATVKCVRAVGCSSRRGRQNAVAVTASSVVPTWFTKLLGIDDFTVHAQATACSPCSSKKFDIVVVLDRTGSMLDRNNGMTDLDNAKDGIRQFLLAMDPDLDYVGLGVFPPAVGGPAPIPPNGTLAPGSNPCLTPGPRRNGYDAWWPAWDGRGGGGSDSAVYTAASLSNDYLLESTPGNWTINGSSGLVGRIGCVQAGGTTSYANALIEAKRELMRNGRADAQDVIVFFTDGAANTMPNDRAIETNRLPNMAPGIAEGLSQIDLGAYWNRPCSAGLAAASWAKGQGGGTQIYTIGYDVSGSNGGNCGEAGVTPTSTLTAMATDPSDFFQPRAGDDLGVVFDRIAADLIKPAGQLIDDTLT